MATFRSTGLFPRDLYGRIASGLAGLCVGPMFAAVFYALVFRPQPSQDWQGRLLGMIGKEASLAFTLFFVCQLIWAVAAPRWLERMETFVLRKLGLAMLLFLIPAVPITVRAFWDLFQARR